MAPFSQAFDFDPIISLHLQQVFEKNSDKLCHFAAIDDGKVVACASIYHKAELAGFYNLATLPEYRNRGIASSLHLARLQHAKKMGFRYATLQATPMATKLDTKLGYEKVGGFHIYMDKT